VAHQHCSDSEERTLKPVQRNVSSGGAREQRSPSHTLTDQLVKGMRAAPRRASRWVREYSAAVKNHRLCIYNLHPHLLRALYLNRHVGGKELHAGSLAQVLLLSRFRPIPLLLGAMSSHVALADSAHHWRDGMLFKSNMSALRTTLWTNRVEAVMVRCQPSMTLRQ
jgi:hypothetical protein